MEVPRAHSGHRCELGAYCRTCLSLECVSGLDGRKDTLGGPTSAGAMRLQEPDRSECQLLLQVSRRSCWTAEHFSLVASAVDCCGPAATQHRQAPHEAHTGEPWASSSLGSMV